MTRAYVYALVDPRDDIAFYIGKGTRRRAWQHWKDFRKNRIFNLKKTQYMADLADAGLQPRIHILAEGLSDFEAFQLEASLISKYAPTLTNNHRSTEMQRCRAWAARALQTIIPLDRWQTIRPRTDQEIGWYHQIKADIQHMSTLGLPT